MAGEKYRVGIIGLGRMGSTIELGDVRLEGGRVAVCTACTGFDDGLLGLDLQRRFEFDLDLKGAKVHLPGCE